MPKWATYPMIVALVGLSGLFSGLTLGLMGLDIIGLQIVMKGENASNARSASKIMPVRESGNQLLCTLLLGNTMVNAALSILTEAEFPGFVGFLASTGLIVVFGEIGPQAMCSRYALQVGALTVPIVRVLMAVFWILAKPMSIALDMLLGQEVGTIHGRQELMEMLKLQISLGAADEVTGEIAKQVAEGALSFRDKQVFEVMTKLQDAYMLSSETALSYETLREIFQTGFSRVPIYGRDKNDYRGLLYTKDLMLADPEDEMKVGDFIRIFNRKVESFEKNTRLVDVLKRFSKGGTHMGLVREADVSDATDPRFEICGVITLEDVMEEILQEEIVDETDVYVHVEKHDAVKDGREEQVLNLGVFNPTWKTSRDRLSREEVNAFAKHLGRTVFTADKELTLSADAVEWLVITTEVQNRQRATPLGTSDIKADDVLYYRGQRTDLCTVVLQGRLGLRVGEEDMKSEAGAFTVLSRDALSEQFYVPDFTAYISTLKVRFLQIQRSKFLAAKEMDEEPEGLAKELAELRRAAEHEEQHRANGASRANQVWPQAVGRRTSIWN